VVRPEETKWVVRGELPYLPLKTLGVHLKHNQKHPISASVPGGIATVGVILINNLKNMLLLNGKFTILSREW
jgi:hypothetical protein